MPVMRTTLPVGGCPIKLMYPGTSLLAKSAGILRSVYLGRSSDKTFDRLSAAAATLAAPGMGHSARLDGSGDLLASHTQAEMTIALATLTHALELAAPEGYVCSC
jgi:hypothetical protein